MNYIIYGANRVAKDFLYIFDKLNILYFIDNDSNLSSFLGYDVKTIEEGLSGTPDAQVIICDFDKTSKEEVLKDNGLVYGIDYQYEEDFFGELDARPIPKERKIAVWGTGNMCRFLFKHRIPRQADIFIDTYRKQVFFQGKPVSLPDEISDWKEYYVIIAVADDHEIREYLLEQGLLEQEDFLSYAEFLELPSVLLRQTIFERAYYDLECHTMQNHLEILPDGNTSCCCTTFVSQRLDNIFEKDSALLWHSVIHKILCLSTENRTFSFCDKTMCPLFIAKRREECTGTSADSKPYRPMAAFPETLALGYDSTCNLACVTCREKLHFAEGKELETVNKITDQVKEEYLPYCKFLILAGNGEVFASPAYRSIYEAEQCNPQYIRLLSNGTLFTPSNWEHFKEKNNVKTMLTVSVDAASKETYQRIRRGNFERLRENMRFASELRRKGELSYFRMNFVVQRENYKEMPAFVQWGQELGVDEVFFTKILNWGTYTPEEFEQISMMEKDGITPKPELKNILQHSSMKSSIVDLGTIQFGHKVDKIDAMENYYMWELEKRGGKLFS